MPTVSAARSAAPAAAARRTDLIKVKVQENDPALKVTAQEFGFAVSGKATNNGIVASALKLSFDGKSVTVPLSRGDDGAKVLQKLKRALPEGYEARSLGRPVNGFLIGIAKTAAPVAPARIPTSISAAGADARVSSSLWANLMPGRTPRPNAIASVKVSGTGFDDRPPTFAVKSIDVYEKGTNRLVATIKNPKLQGSTLTRGTREQSYRLEIPKKDLDLSKQYTFVCNTGINGAAAQKVRSTYVPVAKAY